MLDVAEYDEYEKRLLIEIQKAEKEGNYVHASDLKYILAEYERAKYRAKEG